jgi:GNAT superfamily N-acetyltransferase
MLANTSTGKRTWVAEIERRIVGFADTFPSWDDDADGETAMLGAIYLEKAVTRRGIGRRLMDCLQTDLRSRGYAAVTLWVLDTNERASSFYEALGWHQDGATKTERRPGLELHEVRYRLGL